MATIVIEEPLKRSALPPSGFALFALGFRPFYLLGAVLAALSVPAWLAMFTGAWSQPAVLPGVVWHGHEMVFGFAGAVIIGFLFTAIPKWTGLATPTGRPLAALAGLWLAGRVALLCGPAWLAAALDISLLPIAAAILGRILWRTKNRRNYFVPVLLLALGVANALVHAGAGQWFGPMAVSPLLGLHIGVALIAVLSTVIGGRIVPSFTANAMKVEPWRNVRVDQAAIGLTAVALLAWACELPVALTALLAGGAALVQAVRCAGWRPLSTLRTPLLWVLHVSHGWLIVALLLLAAKPLWPQAGMAVLHVLTIGVIGGLILGMITRTALGHTGRMLVAGRIELAGYLLLHAAVVARVAPVLVAPGSYMGGLKLAGAAWGCAFLLYLWRYGPMLVKPRIDGRPG